MCRLQCASRAAPLRVGVGGATAGDLQARMRACTPLVALHGFFNDVKGRRCAGCRPGRDPVRVQAFPAGIEAHPQRSMAAQDPVQDGVE
jgi:hypothetical protein